MHSTSRPYLHPKHDERMPAHRWRSMRAIPALLVPGLMCLAGSPAGAAAPGARTATLLAEEPGVVVLRLEAPAVDWSDAGGYSYPELLGFGRLDEPGRPALPIRIERIGIPAGVEPRLTILGSTSVPVASRRVGPAQRWVPLVSGSDDRVPLTEEDPAVYGRDALYPAEQPVRFGARGFIREQPFVELIFTPVLYNPVPGVVVAYTSVTVRVEFDEPQALAAGTPEADPAFEDVYENAIVNAGQARAFRRAKREADPPVPDSREAASTLTPVSSQYKLTVRKDGIYRLTGTWLGSNAPGIGGFNLNNLRIDCLGQQIPITVVDANSDGTLSGANDYIEFFGQAIGWDLLSPDDWNSGDYTDDNVYWLYADSALGLRAATRSGAPSDVFTVPTDFVHTAHHHEINDRFVQQVSQDPVDHWYQNPPVTAPSPGNVNFTVATPGLSSAVFTAAMKVRLLGDNYINNLHRSTIKVNGTTVSGPSDWDGFREFTHGVDDGPANFSQSIMSDGNPDTTTVNVTLPLGRGVPSDNVYMNWVEITYRREFKVDSDEILIFTVPNQNTQFRINGLAQNASAIYEISQPVGGTPLYTPIRITGGRGGGAGPFRVDFEITTDGTLPATRRFVVATITGSATTGDLTPAAVRLDVPSNLHNPPQGADWLVVGNANFIDNDVNSSWKALTTRRTNQGLRVAVVDVEDVYDEFSYGIEDPQAIRDFFAYVYASWPRVIPTVPLRYGIVLGDASYDYKNYYGYPQGKNLLSTYMRSVSSSTVLGYLSDETYFATVSGADTMPDFYLGRIPVHSLAETNAYAKKIIDYETSAPGQTWQRNVVFIADDESAFEDVQNRQINTYLVGTNHTYNRSYEGQIAGTLPQKAAEMRDRIQRQLNGQVEPGRDIGPGAAVMSFVGHGSFLTWGSNFSFFAVAASGPDDLTPVTNATKLPLMLVADCISGGFASTNSPAGTDFTYSFGEKFIVAAGKGAAGVIAPSHLTFIFGHDYVEDQFFGDVYGPAKTRNFGKIYMGIQLVFHSIGDELDLWSYTLLGDPAVNLIVPAPAPPTNVSAIPGNHQVTVSWTAAPGAAFYRIYKSENPLGPYFSAATTTGTSKIVTGLTNCAPVYFVVVSVDSGGFEGPYSHFNTGCGSGGPCVFATPRNPFLPSAPTGVTAVDRESGGAVTLSWSPNPSIDEVENYNIYWGIAPEDYTGFQAIGTATTFLLTGLTNDVPYYFVISASNCSQGEGPTSVEVSAVPRRIEGIKPPNSIDGLMVLRSPDVGDGIDDTRLQWTPPAINVYGQATTLDHHEVYRGTTPTFPADLAHKLGNVPGTQGFYIDENAYETGPNYYYLVVAVDTNQNRSGIGRELPRGVDELMVTRSAGTLQFDWPAVTHDLDNRPTLIDHYVLYGRSTPFSRSQIGPALVVLDNLVGTSVSGVPIPGGSLFCYSLIAVDNKGSLSPW